MSEQIISKPDTDDKKLRSNKDHKIQKDQKTHDGNKQHADMNPVFRLKIINARNTECLIKLVGFIKESEKLGDEVVELDLPLHPHYQDVGRHAIPIKSIDKFDMVGRLYRCNVVGSHIVASSRYPIMYLNIEYSRQMVSGSLFQLLFSIDIDRAQKNAVKDTKKYVNLTFTGQWVQHIDCDDEFIEKYESLLQEMLEDEALKKFYYSDDVDKENMSDEQIAEWVKKYVSTERIFYDNIMKEKKVQEELSFKNLTKLRDRYITLCMSDKFHKFLALAMKARDVYRRKQYKIEDDDEQYTIPKNITKLNDVKQQMIDDNELIMSDE
jgi:hypothetical protein